MGVAPRYVIVLRIAFVLTLVSGLLAGLRYATPAAAVNRTWDGGGATSNWSDAANWSGDTVPGVNDIAVFDATSLKDCAIDAAGPQGANVNVTSLTIDSGYSGTINIVSGVGVTVQNTMTHTNGVFNCGSSLLKFDSANYTLSGGSFNCTNGSMEFVDGGTLSVSSGTFNAPSGSLSFTNPSFNSNGNLQINSAATFNHSNGTISFENQFATIDINGGSAASVNLNNLTLATTSNVNFGVGDTIRVLGTLTLSGGRFTQGTLEATNNITIGAGFIGGGSGTGLLRISGAANRTVTLLSSAEVLPRIEVDAPNVLLNTSGTNEVLLHSLNLVQGVVDTGTAPVSFGNVASFRDSSQSGGTFNCGGGLIKFVTANYTMTGGNFNCANSNIEVVSFGTIAVNGGTFNAPSGTLSFSTPGFNTSGVLNIGAGGTFNHNSGTVTFATQLGTIDINGGGSGSAEFFNLVENTTSRLTVASADKVRVLNNLSINQGGVSGNYEVLGNITIASGVDSESGSITFSGTNNQTFTNNGGVNPTGIWAIDKSSGAVTLNSNLDLSNGTSAFNLTNGTITTGPNLINAGTRSVNRNSGYVIGKLQRSYTATGSKTFDVGTANGYSPVSANVTTLGQNPSSLTISATQGAHPNLDPSIALGRHWSVLETGNVTVNLTFNYLDPIDIGGSEANYRVAKIDSNVSFFTEAQAPINRAANSFVANGVTDFATWTLGTPQLLISPANISLSVQGTQTFTASGGIPPFTFSIPTNNSGATINSSTGAYSAGTVAGVQDTVRVTDSESRTANAIVTVGQSAPHHLSITQQPSNTTPGSTITPAVQVAVKDQFNNTIPTATDAITIAIGTNPSSGVLSGTLTRNAVNGVATFNDLTIDKPANGYTLTVNSGSLIGATSNSFNVIGPTQLAFTVQPSNSVVGSSFSPALQVAIKDQLGNIVTTATNLVSISIANNPGSATLSGTTSKNAVNGIATFSDLSLTSSGVGYTLSAASAGLTSATSTAFNVVSPFIVTNTSDSGIGSLRQAITSANDVPGAQTITFNIPGTGPFLIAPATNLPEITEGVVIDGFSQAGSVGTNLQIHISSQEQFGLRVNASASGVVLKGLRISHFLTSLISLAGSGHKVQGCFIGTELHDNHRSFSGIVVNGTGHIIGTDSDGVADVQERNIILGNINDAIAAGGSDHFIRGNYVGVGTVDARGSDTGIRVTGSSMIVGGTLPEQRNVVGNNTNGIVVSGASNKVQGNYIGFEPSGDISAGNSGTGVLVSGNNNVIGASVSTENGAGNLIGKNFVGVSVSGNDNLITQNQIGIDSDFGPGANVSAGIAITGSGNTVGGAGLGNVVGGSPVGISIGGPSPNFVLGNVIGLTGNPGSSATNQTGVLLTSNGNIVGGTTPEARNIISGNARGIRISGNGVSGNQILGNWIGVSGSNGSNIRANTTAGIDFAAGIGANIIGGPTSSPGSGPGNVISGNTSPSQAAGIILNGSGHTIQGNLIGPAAGGTTLIGNNIGIQVDAGTNLTIGGATPDTANVIAGSSIAGIKLTANSSSINIQNNFIGSGATGQNWGNGLGIESAGNNVTIGGVGLGNIIAFNRHGVVVKSGTGVRVVANSIFSNLLGSGSHSGLDLGNNGITQNDPGDADTGPNNLQNYPILNNAFVAGGATHVVGSVNSTPNTAFIIDFYSSSSCNPGGNGEGQVYLGSVTPNPHPSGIVGFAANVLPPVPAGSFITATATDAAGNTSEFSPCRPLGTNSFSISGRVTDNTASTITPLANAVVSLSNPAATTLTTSNGSYTFTDLPGGLTTTITASKTNYNMSPASIAVTNRSIDLPDQNFTGVRTKFAIAGAVLTTINGVTLPLTSVKLTLSGTQSAITTGNASYAFINLNPGTYTVTPELEGYAFSPASADVTITNTDRGVTFNSVPSAAPLEGRIVFKNGSDIASINADGTALVTALKANTNPVSVSLSTDGRDLRYASSNSVMSGDADGLGTFSGSGFTNPAFQSAAWSPNGKVVVKRVGTSGLFVLGGGAPVQIPMGSLANSAGSPSWLSETRIAFSANDGNDPEIYAINIDGTNLVKLTSNSISDVWPVASPDGTRVAFFRSPGATFAIPGNLVVVDVASHVETQLSDKFIGSCAWSPDGTRIAMMERTATDKLVAVRSSDGGGKRTIYNGNLVTFFWGREYEFSTPVGTNVQVNTGNNATVTFGGVTSPGTTTITPLPPVAAGTAPNGFVIGGIAYEISTTAAYTAPVTICFSDLPVNTSGELNAISFMHNEGGVLVDRTSSRSFAVRQICGTVTTLSPFAIAEQVNPDLPSINGFVRDNNGNPLPFVTVNLSGTRTRTTQSNAFGLFAFSNLIPGGNYAVQPKLGSYQFSPYSQDFLNVNDERTVVFTGAPQTFNIAGHVVDENGAALSGVTIELNGGAQSQVTTDSDGQYAFNGLAADLDYTVSVFKDGVEFSPSSQVVAPLTANQDSIDFRVAPTSGPGPTSPVIQFGSANVTVGEGSLHADINIVRSGDTSGASSVSLTSGDLAGAQLCFVNTGAASSRCDYQPIFTSLHFATGETSKTVSVLIVDDAYLEGPESLTLTLSNPIGTTLGVTSSASISITDNDIANGPNPIDVAGTFVRQHYLDFLNREPDSDGLAFWTNEITSCGANAQCVEVKRINVSAAFYLSIEFQETGYLVERLYKTSYGDALGSSVIGGSHTFPVPIVRLNEFLADTQKIGSGVVVGLPGWEQLVESNKQAFVNEFVQRVRFTSALPASLNPGQFVDQLNFNAGNPLSQLERDQLVSELTQGTKTRAQVLRAVAEDEDLRRAEFNKAFVLMQYFGYLRRNPDDAPDADHTGYDFWLMKLNQFNGNFIDAEMVKAFISSIEYRQRFAP